MFEVISTILYVAVVLIAILLICLVLVQPSKGGGFGSAFGGIGESVFGAQAMSQLSKVTVFLLTMFFVLTLVLAVMTGHRSNVRMDTSWVVRLFTSLIPWSMPSISLPVLKANS